MSVNKLLTAVAAPYGVMLGVLYMWGYWTTFHINPFEYGTLTDTLMASIIPLGVALIGLAYGLSHGAVIAGRDPDTSPVLFRRHGITLLNLLLISPLIFFLVGLFVIDSKTFRWETGWMMLLPALVFPKLFFVKTQKTTNGRLFLIAVIIAIAAFSTGKKKAYSVIEGISFQESDIDGERLRLVGYLDEKYFFIDQTNKKIVILTNESAQKLILTFNGKDLDLFEVLTDRIERSTETSGSK